MRMEMLEEAGSRENSAGCSEHFLHTETTRTAHWWSSLSPGTDCDKKDWHRELGPLPCTQSNRIDRDKEDRTAEDVCVTLALCSLVKVPHTGPGHLNCLLFLIIGMMIKYNNDNDDLTNQWERPKEDTCMYICIYLYIYTIYYATMHIYMQYSTCM